MKFNINKIDQWQEVVNSILPFKHNILLLKGNLGAGKTSFTQFLVKSLGSKDEVSSPTYAIVNEYEIPNGKIFHFDLYRMKSIDEVFDIGIYEYLDSGNLCIIEWPEIFEDKLQDFPFHQINIEYTGEERLVEFI